MKDSSAPPKIYLQENVGGGRGRHTTISVLDPYIRIERTDDNQYRIIATFKLQVKIHAFEKGYMRRCEKLFDFVSLRYLYYDLERHKVHPAGDAIARLAVTEENTTTKGFKAGLTGDATMGVVPTAEVSVESDNTLTYERKTKSWRRGFSYEPYAKCDHKWDPAERKGQHPVDHHWRHHHFRVDCAHKNRSCCQNLEPKCEPGASCGYRDPSGKAARRYDRCAHWFWQTEAAAHLWTPEIYESFSETITIARLIPVDIIGEALNEGQNQEKLHQYLHFDFVVTCRLRELGWSFKDYWKRPTKPTEIRAKGDYGYPLATDRVAFCVCCCAHDVRNFPSRPTRELQREAEKEVDEHGPTVRYLPRTKEWKQKKRERKHQDDEKDKKEAQLEEMKRRLTDMELRARLDRIDRELHNKPCNCSGHQEPDIDFVNHTVHLFSPEKYENCHCGTERHDKNQPCDCSSHSRPPETESRHDHERYCRDCCSEGRCRCHSIPPSESPERKTAETPRGRSRVKRGTDEEYSRPMSASMPEAGEFLYHHYHYRSRPHSHHRSLSGNREHSPVLSVDICSVHTSRHASPSRRDHERYPRPQYPAEHQLHHSPTRPKHRLPSRSQLEKEVDGLRARIGQLEGEITEPAKKRHGDEWSNESTADDSSGDETIDNRHGVWDPEPEAQPQQPSPRPDHNHRHLAQTQSRPANYVLTGHSSRRSQHRRRAHGRALVRSLSPIRHPARPESPGMYEEGARGPEYRRFGCEFRERRGRASSMGAKIVEFVTEQPMPRGHRRSREYWRY